MPSSSVGDTRFPLKATFFGCSITMCWRRSASYTLTSNRGRSLLIASPAFSAFSKVSYPDFNCRSTARQYGAARGTVFSCDDSPNSLEGIVGPSSLALFEWPAAGVVETDKAYEITAELPGIDQKNIEVNVANGGVIIKGEKKEETEEKKKDYYVSERRYGSFQP